MGMMLYSGEQLSLEQELISASENTPLAWGKFATEMRNLGKFRILVEKNTIEPTAQCHKILTKFLQSISSYETIESSNENEIG